MRDYQNENISAAEATNILIKSVSEGKVHLQDLTNSLSTILPTASSAGVGLIDVMGAMSTMTGEGVNAANAATYLRQTISSLMSPGAAAVKTLQSIGLTAQEVSNGMAVSFPDTMAMITDALTKKFPEGAALTNAEMLKVKAGTETFDQALQNLSHTGAAQYVSALKDIAGGSKTMQGMLDLTGAHVATFQGDVDAINQSVKEGGNNIRTRQ